MTNLPLYKRGKIWYNGNVVWELRGELFFVFGGDRADSPFYARTAHLGYAELRAALFGVGVFILCRTAKNEPRKRAKGLCPLDSRGARLKLSIFPPRGKNVYQHFSSVAKMTFTIEKARREIQRFPSYGGAWMSPFRLASRF